MFKRTLIAVGLLSLSAAAMAADNTVVPQVTKPVTGTTVSPNDDSSTTNEITTPAPAESSTSIERTDSGATVRNRSNVPGANSGSANSASSESLISINKAGASELATQLKLTSDQASAIVKFRRENGPITSDADLRDVKGLDAATIKRLKGRIDFAAKAEGKDAKAEAKSSN